MTAAAGPEIELLLQTRALMVSDAVAGSERLGAAGASAGTLAARPLGVSRELARKVREGGKENVLSALQDAIKVEHSTIPTYLYALYSLDQAANPEIVELIQSVVVEEMLHMTLACNILNALGGSPQIDRPDFIPTYPNPLPGIEPPDPTWVVELAPFSKHVVRKIFMQIELPDYPVDVPDTKIYEPAAPDDEPEPTTIGQFYSQLAEQIKKLGDAAFVSPAPNQVGPDIMCESIVVSDVETACQAIDLIIDQGEGTDIDPFDENGDPAHFYRFAEIVVGHKLIEKDGHYVYEGDLIPFESGGVHRVYPAQGSQQANITFNYTYTNLLKTLHGLFNGLNTQEQFHAALGLMMSLKQQAKDMMATQHFGPSFQYQPTNP